MLCPGTLMSDRGRLFYQFLPFPSLPFPPLPSPPLFLSFFHSLFFLSFSLFFPKLGDLEEKYEGSTISQAVLCRRDLIYSTDYQWVREGLNLKISEKYLNSIYRRALLGATLFPRRNKLPWDGDTPPSQTSLLNEVL